ncbi:type VI secretion system lipoprotein TssJ [Xenorhabdus kozodoii]|uniref:Lipoprotein n=1 Tax=Xenorhabdus kozodoii TaxID=351676 RepID=A0A2D0LA18_9GAMM|nr:type VI secretion system lipoprotein TssJ [Xenorhabdus kozodoii]PHM72502.1 lipoprotein [Xenorhabdus kozodoii]
MVNTKSASHTNPPCSDKTFSREIIGNRFSIRYRLSSKWAMLALLFLHVVVFNIIVFNILVLTGCSSSEQKKSPPYQLIFHATNNVNDSAPLKIHVILLKSTSGFMSADFFSLQGNAQAVLGNQLVNSEQLFLLPFQHKRFLLEKNIPEASYIGILAEYKQLDGKKWRISLPVPTLKPSAFYQFWASPPDTLDICIQVTANGLNFIDKCH